MKWLIAIALLLCFSIGNALAVMPDEVLKDAGLEARARSLSKELRCMVCQNQSIDDSEAQLARDLRVLVRERLVAGDSNAEVLDYVEQRYGAFVLLKPRFNAQTIALWTSPLLVIGFGIVLIWRRKVAIGSASIDALTLEEEARIETLLKDRHS